MFTKKSHVDIKKSTSKIQDSRKDSTTRLRHLKVILDNVDIEDAKSFFELNYSHIYYILYDIFVQAEANLKQRVHKAHREELDGSLWLLGKLLCLLPELTARRWQCHSLGRIMSKLLHPGNSGKLRREGVRYFLLWYQSLGENAPSHVHAMFTELVPGLSVPHKNLAGPIVSDTEFSPGDFLNHPNMKGELGGSVFHDAVVHPVVCPEITPLLPPASNERSAAPDPRDGLEILLDCMVQATGCLKWRDNSPQRHIKCFTFLLYRFREVYLPVFCPNFDNFTSIYEPKLDLPFMRTINKREELMSSCVVVLINWISKFTYDRGSSNRLDHVQIEEDFGEQASLLSNLRSMGFSQIQLVRDVLYSSRDTINFVHETYRQAFLLNFNSKSQIEAMRVAILVYREWMTNTPPPFLLEPIEDNTSSSSTSEPIVPRSQRLRTDSYLGAICKENYLIRAGLQNVLQIFVTHAANVFMIQTSHLNILFQSKSRESTTTTPLDEQMDICKRVLNIYRTMVMNTRMDAKTWEQLLLVLLQITSIILSQAAPNSKKNNLGGRLAQAIFQTLIVTWIRAHTNVPVNGLLWEKFLSVLSSLTHREELIIEWDKTMQTLTRVLAKQVYNLNLQDLPLDRLAEQKGKRRRGVAVWQPNNVSGVSDEPTGASQHHKIERSDDMSDANRPLDQETKNAIPGTPSLNRSYSEGSLAPSFRKSRARRRIRHQHKVLALESNVENSLNRILSSTPSNVSSSVDNLDVSRASLTGTMGSGTLRRALSLDSVRPDLKADDSESPFGSRTPSPTASSGIEGGSIKDSPMQIDVFAGDSSSIDTQDDGQYAADRRSILAGGVARGWLPDVAAVMWKRMLGALGNINRILNPKLHAQVFRHLADMTESLIKIRMNQGISNDNQSTPAPPAYVPPISIVAPWCYGALELDAQYREGKLWALQLLCTIARYGPPLGSDQLPLFYNALHQALTGEDRAMACKIIGYLGGSRFLSLLLPGHTLLLLDLVHASTVILNSNETDVNVPRSEVTSLLGSLLCFPSTAIPKPVLQPSEPLVELMECPDIQDHILNIVLRCARREPTSRARCIAIGSLGVWILQNLSNSAYASKSFAQAVPHSKKTLPKREGIMSPRIVEAIQVILQALQFKHRTIARIAAETLKLCAEKGRKIARIERLPHLIINALCIALEIQNTAHPKDSDKTVLTSLMLCLGEFCMQIPVRFLLQSQNGDSDKLLISGVLKILHQIATGTQTNKIKLFTADEDFDMSITLDNVKDNASAEASYQTADTIQSCLSGIRLCARTVTMHLVTHLAHFPMGIGASRLSALVDEQDDLSLGHFNVQPHPRDSVELGTSLVINAPNLQMFMLNTGLVASFIELPALKLPGGGVTAGLVTANRQVRVLMRDLNGKACWDASILYKEPVLVNENRDINRELRSSKIPMIEKHPSAFFSRQFQATGRNIFVGGSTSLDPLTSNIGIPIKPLRHTLRHRPPNHLPVAKDLSPDLDQLDDLLQYIGHTSCECLDSQTSMLNTPGRSLLHGGVEAQAISIILNQRGLEQDFVGRQANLLGNMDGMQSEIYGESRCSGSFNDDPHDNGSNRSENNSPNRGDHIAFNYCRLLFSQLGLAGWERRKRTHLLHRTDKLLRELRNLDTQQCRETHKMAVIYVASGQEDKNSILRNSCGSCTYEMFVSALGWEIELESHNGFFGGLPRQGCGQTAPYYATPFLEVIYHVATRMPCDTPEAILNKTRHLGNDEVHIVWSEHCRDYRRDILPTEFCDILIAIYPLKSGLFRVTVNRKHEVPWFGPLWDEAVVSGACLAKLVRATAINASRAKRTALPLYQQFYEERNRSLDAVATRHKEGTAYEDFVARIFSPVPVSSTTGSMHPSGESAPLAAALLDHQRRSKGSVREASQQTITLGNVTHDHPSPRPLRKLPHPFKVAPKKLSHHHSQTGAHTPPESPTLPGRKFK